MILSARSARMLAVISALAIASAAIVIAVSVTDNGDSNGTSYVVGDDTSMPMSAFPVSEKKVCENYYTIYDSFTISSVEELEIFSDLVNGDFNSMSKRDFANKTVYLTTDLDLSSLSNFVPIGTGGDIFSGTFYGNGHTISNMTIDAKASDSTANPYKYAGFFGNVSSAAVYDITIKDSTITGSAYVGAIAGLASSSYLYGCSNDNTTVIFSNDGSVDGGTSMSTNSFSIGGLFGKLYYPMSMDSDLHYINSSGDVIVSEVPANKNIAVGGLVGHVQLDDTNLWGGTFTGSIFVDISNDMSSLSVGGVIGYARSSNGGIFEECSNRGTISVETGKITGEACVGGVVGYTSTAVSKAINAGDINVSVGRNSDNKDNYLYVGGVVGFAALSSNHAADLSGCSNHATVHLDLVEKSRDMYVGGVVGMTVYDIASCYNVGDVVVHITKFVGGYGTNIAGVVGSFNGGNTGGDSVLKDCYNTGSIEMDMYNKSTWANYYSTINAAGIAAYVKGGTVTSCYNTAIDLPYFTATSGGNSVHSNAGGIVGKETTSDPTYSGYLGYKFDNDGNAGTATVDFNYLVGCNYVNGDYNQAGVKGSNYASDYLKGSDFLSTLNTGGSGIWVADSDNMNGGYPLLGTSMDASLQYSTEYQMLYVTVTNQESSDVSYEWQEYDLVSGEWSTIQVTTQSMMSISATQPGMYRVLVFNTCPLGVMHKTVTNTYTNFTVQNISGIISYGEQVPVKNAEVSITLTTGTGTYAYVDTTDENGYYEISAVKSYVDDSTDSRFGVFCVGYVEVDAEFQNWTVDGSDYVFNYTVNKTTVPSIYGSPYYYDDALPLRSNVGIIFDIAGYSEVSSVDVGDSTLSTGNWSVSGNVLTISSSYLTNLTNGTYTVTVGFTKDGGTATASTDLEVAESDVPSVGTPLTYYSSSGGDLSATLSNGTGILQAWSVYVVGPNGVRL